MSPWATLGLKRTDNVNEIRRAYARKLKATDVDADPAAFVALRDALERALAEAEASRRQAAAEAGPALPTEIVPDVAPADMPATAEPAAPQPEEPAGEDPEARFIALGNLLFPGEGAPPPDPDALAGAVREILDHPEMDHVDRSAKVEAWLARLLYDAAPNSDPVLPMVIDHFHWDRKAGHWDQPELFEALLQRRNAFRLLDQLAYRSHPLHAAWRDLTSDEPTIGLRPIGRRGDVTRLLSRIRAEAPLAEAYLNPHRIALWEGHASDTGGGGSGLNWIWIAVVALVALGRLGSAINSPSTSTLPISHYGLTDPGVDLNPILSRVSEGRLDLDGLETTNPRLHLLLVDAWRAASARGDSALNLEGDAAAVLDNFFRDSIRAAPADIQADYWGLKVDQLEWMRRQGSRTCERIGQDQANYSRYGFPAEMQRRFLDLQVSVWRSVSGPPPPRQSSATIPGPIATAAALRAHLDPDTFRQAMRGNATPETLCAAQIALAETALARPPAESARLLRELTSIE